MAVPRTYSAFDTLLNLAQEARRIRLDVGQFHGEWLTLRNACNAEWIGPARDEFDRHWASLETAKDFSEQELQRNERDLISDWVDGVNDHNSKSYDLAIEAASRALQAEREEHNALVEAFADLDAMTISVFNDRPSERVERIPVSVTAPSEASDYESTASFVHYRQVSNNRWTASVHTYPNNTVCEAL